MSDDILKDVTFTSNINKLDLEVKTTLPEYKFRSIINEDKKYIEDMSQQTATAYFYGENKIPWYKKLWRRIFK